MVWLSLKNYSIPGVKNRKLTSPRTGPFIIKRIVRNLACELSLLAHFKIHPVISIAELELVPNTVDPF